MRISDLKMILSGGPFFMEPQDSEQYKELLESLLQGNSALSEHINMETPEPLVMMGDGSAYSYSSENPSKGQGILLMHMDNVIMRNDGPCGMMGTESMAQLLYNGYADESIAGIVVEVDSPGGAANAIEVMTDALATRNKPVLFHVKDLCASAAYWIASQGDGIYSNYRMSRIGSIGTMITIKDQNKKLEKEGVEIKTYYAKQSKRKNNLSRALEDGNAKPLIDELTMHCADFISAVAESRSISEDHEVFEGDAYMTAKALSFGLIDGTLTLAATIEKCFAMAEDFEPKNKEQMFGKKYKAVDALVTTKAEERTEEMVEAANAELQAAGLDAVIVSKEDFEGLDDSIKDVKQKLSEAEASVKPLKESVKNLETEQTALQAIAEEVFGEEAVKAEGFDLGASLKALKAERDTLAKVVPGGANPEGGDDPEIDGGGQEMSDLEKRLRAEAEELK